MAIDKEAERAVLILLGISILSKLGDLLSDAGKVLQQNGAKLYDVLHDDSGHQQDLPSGPGGSGHALPREAILAIATLAGFPDPKLAAAIAMAESGGFANALARSSREISVGLWQINTMVHPYTVEDMREPMKNAAAAFKISKSGKNWKPWSAYTNGRYKQFQTGVLA